MCIEIFQEDKIKTKMIAKKDIYNKSNIFKDCEALINYQLMITGKNEIQWWNIWIYRYSTWWILLYYKYEEYRWYQFSLTKIRLIHNW